jgi:hypothetical protein
MGQRKSCTPIPPKVPSNPDMPDFTHHSVDHRKWNYKETNVRKQRFCSLLDESNRITMAIEDLMVGD